eukprot:COSAG06_NODE_2097_length_7603_cov_5.875933_9_plen_308_part_00
MWRFVTSTTPKEMNLLTSTPIEFIMGVACALTSAKDLLCLKLTSKSFSAVCIVAPSSGGGGPAAAPAEMLCIVEEAARRWFAECTEQERGWVPRHGREIWLRLMWEVELLRRSAVFGRSHGSITLSEGGAVATGTTDDDVVYVDTDDAAASTVVMRAGRHFAQFAGVSGHLDHVFFGVIRPGWDVEAGTDAQTVHGHCFYNPFNGRHMPDYRNWEGRQTAREDGDRIGMLLDLDQGTMTVYKNDERLGVMATGLRGEYCWAVGLYWQGHSVRIESAQAPASPTATELAQAVAYIAEHGDDGPDGDDY